MPGCPRLEHETVSAAGLKRREHLDNRFYQSAPKQGEREDVCRRRWNGSAALTLQRADHFVLRIAQERRELLAVAFDVNGGDKLVVAPNLAARAVRDHGGHRKIDHVVCRNRVAWRQRQDSQADFVVRTDIRLAILDAVERNDGLSILLRNGLQAGASKKLGRSVQLGRKCGDEALNVEIADGQRTLRSIAEDAPLEREID